MVNYVSSNGSLQRCDAAWRRSPLEFVCPGSSHLRGFISHWAAIAQRFTCMATIPWIALIQPAPCSHPATIASAVQLDPMAHSTGVLYNYSAAIACCKWRVSFESVQITWMLILVWVPIFTKCLSELKWCLYSLGIYFH